MAGLALSLALRLSFFSHASNEVNLPWRHKPPYGQQNGATQPEHSRPRRRPNLTPHEVDNAKTKYRIREGRKSLNRLSASCGVCHPRCKSRKSQSNKCPDLLGVLNLALALWLWGVASVNSLARAKEVKKGG